MTATIMKEQKIKKLGWEYLKTWVGIFQEEIFCVGIFRVEVFLIPFDNTLQKFSVELNRADYCMETSLLYYREMNLKITL